MLQLKGKPILPASIPSSFPSPHLSFFCPAAHNKPGACAFCQFPVVAEVSRPFQPILGFPVVIKSWLMHSLLLPWLILALSVLGEVPRPYRSSRFFVSKEAVEIKQAF